MKLLLHTCCAPCTIYPLEKALKDGYNDITLFYYNPNIQPEKEFNKRKDEVRKIVKLFMQDRSFASLRMTEGDLSGQDDIGIKTVYEEYDPKEFFNNVSDYDQPKKRCFECWSLRMKRTAEYAKEHNFDAFTSTLLVSPYQDNKVLKELGEQFSKEYGVKFYYKDFQEGFKQAHEKAHAEGIYCQNYCGCVFSIMEREERRLSRKAKSI